MRQLTAHGRVLRPYLGLKFIEQTGATFTTQTKSKSHFAEDLEIFDFKLSDGDMATLIERFGADARRLLADLPQFLAGSYHAHWQADFEAWTEAGLDEALAARIASADAGGAAGVHGARARGQGRGARRQGRGHIPGPPG